MATDPEALPDLVTRLQQQIARRRVFQKDHIGEVEAWRGEHPAACPVCAQLTLDLHLLQDALAVVGGAVANPRLERVSTQDEGNLMVPLGDDDDGA